MENCSIRNFQWLYRYYVLQNGPKAQKNYDNFEQQKLTISLLNTISIRPETQKKKLQRQETEHTSVKSF